MKAARLIEKYQKDLGLTPHEAAMYEYLLDHGARAALEIAEQLDCLPNAVYRLGRALQEYGFVVVIKRRPIKYQAVPLRAAVERVRERQTRQEDAMYSALLNVASLKREGSKYEVETVIGRQALYERYIEESARAKQEILIFAIGIAYSEQLKASQAAALERGVHIRHIIQKKDPDNYHVIHTWRRMGVKLRHYPAPAGFHLMIFDAERVILTLSNPTETDERISLVVRHPVAAGTLRDYFFTIWAKSRLLDM
jgi:sugar-specific transcriptional regulator TrmB